VIPEIHARGTNVAGLLAYLFGPGKREEHVNPHLIAAWTGSPDLETLQPSGTRTGRHNITHLARLLNQPVNAARRAPPKTVWHCSVRNHPTDRTLSDQQWRHIAAEIMHAVGLAPHGDPHAVRWVAVRHAADHIHIVATLVRQDGRTAWAWNDRPRAQAAARDLESRYGLHQVGPVDRTAHTRPGAAEVNKTRRQQRAEVPRDRLRREVRAAAAAAHAETDFLTRLRATGVLVRLRHSTTDPEQITGYAVGLPGHHTATGATIWYGGGRLAPDLTLPKLRHRWTDHSHTPPGPAAHRSDSRQPRTAALRDTTRTVRQAVGDVHRLAGSEPRTASAIGSAAADVLTVLARAREGRHGGPLTNAAELLDRAARNPAGRPHARAPRAAHLRSLARLIAATGRLTSTDDTTAALELVLQIAALADTLADLRRAQQRLHQARDALRCAEHLRALVTSTGTHDGAPTTAAYPVPASSPQATPGR